MLAPTGGARTYPCQNKFSKFDWNRKLCSIMVSIDFDFFVQKKPKNMNLSQKRIMTPPTCPEEFTEEDFANIPTEEITDDDVDDAMFRVNTHMVQPAAVDCRICATVDDQHLTWICPYCDRRPFYAICRICGEECVKNKVQLGTVCTMQYNNVYDQQTKGTTFTCLCEECADHRDPRARLRLEEVISNVCNIRLLEYKLTHFYF